MEGTTRIGIVICDRYRRCAGGKCFRSLRNREGAFSRYAGMEVEVVYGTHPIPQSYHDSHQKLNTWADPAWKEVLKPTLADQQTRLAYN